MPDTVELGGDPARIANAARLRALAAFVALLIGFAFARLAQGDTPAIAWVAMAVLGIAAAAFAIRNGRGRLASFGLCLSMVGVGAAVWTARVESAPPHRLDQTLERLAAPADTRGRRLIEVEGILLATPRIEPPVIDPFAEFSMSQASAATTLRAERLIGDGGSVDVSGLLRLTINGKPDPALQGGTRVRVLGWHRSPSPSLNPGSIDSVRWARSANRVGSLQAPSSESVKVIKPIASPLIRVQDAAQGWLREVLGLDRSGVGPAVVGALLLGEDTPALDDTRDALRRTGAAHLLAISGLHVGLAIMVVAIAVRLTGDRGRLEPLAAILVALAYAAVLPARASVVRAIAFGVALLASRAIGRRWDPLTVLIWTALALAIAGPMQITTAGFQLSFGVTALLVWLASTRPPWVNPPVLIGADARRFRRSFVSRLVQGVRPAMVVSGACALLSAPIVAQRFGVVAPYQVIATALLTPLVAMAIVGGAVTVVVAAFSDLLAAIAGVSLPIADFAALLTAGAGWLLAAGADLIDSVPGAGLRVGPLPWWWSLAAVTTVILLIATARGGPLHRDGRFRWALTAMLLVAIAAVPLASSHAATRGAAARFDAFAVGDGSAFLLRADGAGIMWDCGSLAPGLAADVIRRSARVLGVSEINAAIITHANVDHFNGLPALASDYGITRVFVGPSVARAWVDPDSPEARLRSLLKAQGIEPTVIARGATITLGNTTIDILWPPADLSNDATWLDNDLSLVALWRIPTAIGERRVLLTGDIEDRAIRGLRALHPELTADAIELPHHGSPSPDAMAFIDSLESPVVLQSTGPRRIDDPRWADVRSRTPRWLTTSRDGAAWVRIETDGDVRSGSTRRVSISAASEAPPQPHAAAEDF